MLFLFIFYYNYLFYYIGGGIVYDSLEEDEYQETINKLKSNVICIDQAEQFYYELQQKL